MTLRRIPTTVEEAHAVLDEILEAAVDEGRFAANEYNSLIGYIEDVVFSFTEDTTGLRS